MRTTIQRHVANWTILMPLGMGLAGCLSGPGFLKQEGNASLTNGTSQINATVISSENGAMTAEYSAASGDAQVMSAAADSAISGSSVLFPAGAIAIDTQITIEEGASLATTDVATELGISGASLNAASGAVVVAAAADINASQPFTVAIPLAGAGLRLLQEDRSRLVVVFKVKKAGEGYFTGVIPNSALIFEGDAVKFETSNFGSFQAVYTDAVIAEKKEVAAAVPIITKREELTLPDVKDLAVIAVSASSIELKWASSGGSTAGYAIAMREGGLAPLSCLNAKAKVGSSATTTFKIADLKAGTSYGFRVCAADPTGRMSSGATIVAQTAIASRPGQFFLNDFDSSDGPIKVVNDFAFNWTPAPGAVDYLVALGKTPTCTNLLQPQAVVTTTEVDESTEEFADGLYFLCVFARNGAGTRLMQPVVGVEIERTVVVLAAQRSSDSKIVTIEYEPFSGLGTYSHVMDGANQLGGTPSTARLAENGDGKVALLLQWNPPTGSPIFHEVGTNVIDALVPSPSTSKYAQSANLIAKDDDFVAIYSKNYEMAVPTTAYYMSHLADTDPPSTPPVVANASPSYSGKEIVSMSSTAVPPTTAGGVIDEASAVLWKDSSDVLRLSMVSNSAMNLVPDSAWLQDCLPTAVSLAVSKARVPHILLQCRAANNCRFKIGVPQATAPFWQFRDIAADTTSGCDAKYSRPDLHYDPAGNSMHAVWRHENNIRHWSAKLPLPATLPAPVELPKLVANHEAHGEPFVRIDQYGKPYVFAWAESSPTDTVANTGFAANQNYLLVIDRNGPAWVARSPDIISATDGVTKLLNFVVGDGIIKGSPGRSVWP